MTDENIEIAANCLSTQWPKFKIKRHLERINKEVLMKNKKPGKMGIKTFNTILIRARQRINAQFDRPFEETLMETMREYWRIYNDLNTEPRDKLKALERINALLGHDAKFSRMEDDAETIARSIRDAAKGMRGTVPSEDENGDK